MTFTEKEQDIFELSNKDNYYFVQCISSDFKMGKGIALEFNRVFNCKNELVKEFKNFKWENTGRCIKAKNSIVFHLITKNKYWDKPTYRTLKESLIELKTLCIEQNIKKLVMPKIGCGLDKLQWNTVKENIIKIFNDTDIEILICYLD